MLATTNYPGGAQVAVIDKLAHELMLLVRGLRGLHAAVAIEAGLRVDLPAVGILSLLHEHGRLRVSTLAELLRVDLSSVSRQVAALEREGWLCREPDPADQRASLLQVTAAGDDVVEKLRIAKASVLRRALPGWTDEELLECAGRLHRLSADLSARGADTRPDLRTRSDIRPRLDLRDDSRPALAAAGQEAL